MGEKISTRKAYGEALVELGANHEFWVLDGDLSKATLTTMFAEKYPERFFNMGISECDLMSTAAGIASCGRPVFASTFAMFAAGRAYEQVRNQIGYTRLNVKIGATHGGVLIGEDGGSHQCIEDLALMRAIPGMVVLAPADGVETKATVKAALEYDGPVYLRFGRYDVPVLYETRDFVFEIGKGRIVRAGKEISLIAIGDMVYEALEAAALLSGEGIDARVIDMGSVKPIDQEMIIRAARETGGIVTAEDHNIVGGLGSAVAEVLAENCPVPLRRVGIRDIFGRSGKPNDLAEYFGLNAKTIAAKAREILA